MSDPVTNVEIEDVLSSIRKLVADDSRVAPEKPKPQADKLVLTPAQRVMDDTAEPKTDLESPAPKDPKVVEERQIEDIPGDARLSDFGEVSGAFPDIDEFESERAQAADVADEELAEPVHADRLDLSQLIEKEVAAALSSSDATDAYSDPIAEEAALIEEDALHWDEMEAEAAFEETFETQDAESADDVTEAAQVYEDYEENSAGNVADAPLTLEDKVAALGRLVARDTTQEFEEERDAPNADELTATSEKMSWPEDVSFEDETEPSEINETAEAEQPPIVFRSEHAWSVQSEVADDFEAEAETMDASFEHYDAFETSHAAAIAEHEHGPDLQTTTMPSVATPEPALQLDEEMLRVMVGQIVREELQGALGERITRNVRKLVRREIHRMLVSQELE